MKYIYSTLTGGHDYTIYRLNPQGVHHVLKSIRVNGGSNLADRRTLITPRGVLTRVSDEDFEFLKQSPLFHKHVKAGFIVISEAEEAIEAVVPDMVTRDESAPLTPNDYDNNDSTQAKPQGMRAA